MTKIIYKRRYNSLPDEEGAIILKEISGVGIDKVEINVEELPSGYLSIGDERAESKGGTVTLDLSRLGDGLYTPIFAVGTKALLCSPIIKRGNVLIRPLPDGGDISRLELLISDLTARAEALEVKVAELEKKILGSVLEL